MDRTFGVVLGIQAACLLMTAIMLVSSANAALAPPTPSDDVPTYDASTGEWATFDDHFGLTVGDTLELRPGDVSEGWGDLYLNDTDMVLTIPRGTTAGGLIAPLQEDDDE